MKKATAALLLCLALASPVRAASSIDNLYPVPIYPLPDPALTSSNLWITQGGVDYRISPTLLGYIFQGTLPPQFPFTNQLWWDISSTPAQIKVYQGGVWSMFPSLSGFAPLDSPHFTGIPTAPTAPPGTNTDQIATTAFVQAATRLVVNGQVILYVTGNGGGGTDAPNNCLNQASPCATIQYAVNLIANNYDFRGGAGQIRLLDGNYNINTVTIADSFVGLGNTGSFNILGNSSLPDNVNIVCSASCFNIALGGHVLLDGMKLTSTQDSIWVHDFAVVNYQNIDFGTAGFQQIFAAENGIAQATGNYTISGGALNHWRTANGGRIFGFPVTFPGAPFPNVVINLVGSPAFSNAFATASQHSQIRAGNSIFTGSGATGVRYTVNLVSLIDTSGGGANFLPGSIAGTADGATFGAYN